MAKTQLRKGGKNLKSEAVPPKLPKIFDNPGKFPLVELPAFLLNLVQNRSHPRRFRTGNPLGDMEQFTNWPSLVIHSPIAVHLRM